MWKYKFGSHLVIDDKLDVSEYNWKKEVQRLGRKTEESAMEIKGVSSKEKKTKLTDEDVLSRWEWSALLNAADTSMKMSPESWFLDLERVVGLKVWLEWGLESMGGKEKREKLLPVICTVDGGRTMEC